MTANGFMRKWEYADELANFIVDKLSCGNPLVKTAKYGQNSLRSVLAVIFEVQSHYGTKDLEEVLKAVGAWEGILEKRNDYIVKHNIELELAGKKPIPFAS